MANKDIVVVGASAGGFEPLKQLIKNLPTHLDISLFVVLHTTAHKKSFLADILAPLTTFHVTAAEHNTKIRKKHIYIAPAFCQTYDIALNEMIGKNIYDINKWNSPKFKKYLTESINNNQDELEPFTLEQSMANNTVKKIKAKARPVYSDKLGNDFLILTLE